MTPKEEEVTVLQALNWQKMANEKGVTRKQAQKHEKNISIALDAIKQGALVQIVPRATRTIEPPPWGRIYLVDNVPVQLDQEWQSAINEAGPDTPDHYDVRKVGNLYLPTGTGIVRANFILVNLNGDHYQDALVWAKRSELPPASPRHVFSLAKAHPNLNIELGMDPCYMVSSQEVAFRGDARVCSVWFFGRGRGAYARWLESVRNAGVWVAFLRE